MKALRAIEIQPELPERLAGLPALSYDLWWCWQADAVQFLRQLDPALWEATGHNPVKMIGTIGSKRLQELACDERITNQLDRLTQRRADYESQSTWFATAHGDNHTPRIAYLSAEFGLNECLPIYSGGLGILAGDHLKAAGELGVPIVGVGLLYQSGLFQQYLNADGWQQERHPVNDFYNLPVIPFHAPDGTPLRIRIAFPGRDVTAQVWEVHVGRVKLLLLDTNIPDNSPADREITSELYGGDHIRRIEQEIVLGIGGVRTLQAAGWHCMATHLNEGHSAFCALERIRILMSDRDISYAEALVLVRKSTIFTTHTPVPAGIDEFGEEQMREYFESYADELCVPWDEFMALGRLNHTDDPKTFNMACLALNLSLRANGVSLRHGRVARRMWKRAWPGVPVEEVPIDSVTNSVHARSWISAEMASLFDRYLGSAWVDNPGDPTVWNGIDDIPDEELWRTHSRRRERLVALARRCLAENFVRRGVSDHEVDSVRSVLDPNALTIGFARRFATYKRAMLLFRDRERIRKILTSAGRPVQIIIAGKAHPRDHAGKELIKEILHFAQTPEVRRQVVFLEDYDIALARSMVQGVDLWLNTPRRPMEASGTSGMKALFNGALNASILDGWWAEAYTRDRGWAIDSGENYDDFDLQDEVESNALYHLLEEEIVPLFYKRGDDGLPQDWITRMKTSMRELCPQFDANRMVRKYTEKYYLPALADCEALTSDPAALSEFCHWTENVRRHWSNVAVTSVETAGPSGITVGHPFTITAAVNLGGLRPDDVRVQLYFGLLDPDGDITGARVFNLTDPQPVSEGRWTYSATISRPCSGRYGYSVRVLPSHPSMTHPFELALIRWPDERLTRLD